MSKKNTPTDNKVPSPERTRELFDGAPTNLTLLELFELVLAVTARQNGFQLWRQFGIDLSQQPIAEYCDRPTINLPTDILQ